MSPILVTGSNGTIGGKVVAALTNAGADVRPADLDTPFDFTKPQTWGVFDDVETMFLVRPPALSNIARDMIPSLEAARKSGVRHVVLLSLQGAEHNKVVPHAKIEAWLRSSGMNWTFVRPSFFMENLTTTPASDIRERNEICVPAGSGATAFVAAHDVAAVACVALLNPGEHRFRAWTPTGPDALTYDEVAAILTQTLGRQITYTRPGLLRYLRHATRTLEMPLPMALVTSAIYTVARMGRAAGLTDDVQQVTGCAPLDFRQWAGQNRQVWQ